MEPKTGIEPAFSPYQSDVLPLNEIGVEPERRIELRYQRYECCALPTELFRQNLRRMKNAMRGGRRYAVLLVAVLDVKCCIEVVLLYTCLALVGIRSFVFSPEFLRHRGRYLTECTYSDD